MAIPMRRLLATMVDVSDKTRSFRTAVASGSIRYPALIFPRILSHGSPKGDLISISRTAGIAAAKRTSLLLPLCHNLPLDKVSVEISPDEQNCSFVVRAEVRTEGKTGVEMEALTAVSAACLNLYDMTKSLSQEIVIERIALDRKTGGKSDYLAGQ